MILTLKLLFQKTTPDDCLGCNKTGWDKQQRGMGVVLDFLCQTYLSLIITDAFGAKTFDKVLKFSPVCFQGKEKSKEACH